MPALRVCESKPKPPELEVAHAWRSSCLEPRPVMPSCECRDPFHLQPDYALRISFGMAESERRNPKLASLKV